MIVVLSQNKDKIIDCNNLVAEAESFSLYTGVSKEWCVREYRDQGSYHELGKYPTEERAKEVVSIIWNWMINGDVGANNQTYFEMPQE